MPAPLPIRAINHLARTTRHLEESRAFYRDILGFRELPRPNFSFPGAWLYGHGLQIHLIVDESAPKEKGEISTRTDHLALHVDDVAEAERRLTEHGVPFRRNYVPQRDVTQLFFHDPDGHHIEIARYPVMEEAPMILRELAASGPG
jgi:catechol 2,3-dioxygenase-like lactoylglutathione lyase family enzyme